MKIALSNKFKKTIKHTKKYLKEVADGTEKYEEEQLKRASGIDPDNENANGSYKVEIIKNNIEK